MDIVGSPVADGLRSLLRRVSSELTVVSPWIKMEGVGGIASVLRRRNVACRVLMRGDLSDFVSGSSDVGAVRRLLDAGATVGLISNLHAKVYLADRACALVGSANLTGPGMRGNAELGVIVDDEPTVATLHGLLDEWFARAREVDAKWLALMERAAGECSAEKRQAAAAEDVVRHRGRALGGPRIWSGTRGQRGGMAPAAPFPEGLWAEQLADWLKRKKLGSLVPDAIRFFGLAFADLPEEAYEWAYWGALP